ncbi:hypothetical protein [Pseudomonas sp. TH31]|uniref:hypothetical protein n=1 Tax=Pseudomonas sp. TH31 TaxID=2796396 RepID=UPI001F5BDD14|nr:hypothetical protein [Pseudomonas sp. TH31]
MSWLPCAYTHQIQDLIIVVLPVCPVQAQSTLGFFQMTSENIKIGMTGLTGGAGPCRSCRRLRSFDLDLDLHRSIEHQNQKIAAFGSSYAPVGASEGCDLLIFLTGEKKPAITDRFFTAAI